MCSLSLHLTSCRPPSTQRGKEEHFPLLPRSIQTFDGVVGMSDCSDGPTIHHIFRLSINLSVNDLVASMAISRQYSLQIKWDKNEIWDGEIVWLIGHFPLSHLCQFVHEKLDCQTGPWNDHDHNPQMKGVKSLWLLFCTLSFYPPSLSRHPLQLNCRLIFIPLPRKNSSSP